MNTRAAGNWERVDNRQRPTTGKRAIEIPIQPMPIPQQRQRSLFASVTIPARKKQAEELAAEKKRKLEQRETARREADQKRKEAMEKAKQRRLLADAVKKQRPTSAPAKSGAPNASSGFSLIEIQ
jgi:hypothetical protein